MKKRIDPVAIKSVGTYMENQIELLKRAQQKLLIDIGKIEGVYKGVDSSLLASKYKERVLQINSILLNYENYSKYMRMVAGAYSDNVNESKKQFRTNMDRNVLANRKEVNYDQNISEEIFENLKSNTYEI